MIHPLLEEKLGAKVAVIDVSSACLADVLAPVDESIEMVLLGHDIISVGESSLVEVLTQAGWVDALKTDCGLVLNRFGLLDIGDIDAVRSVEEFYRAAAERNEVEEMADREVAMIESVAVFAEPRLLPPLESSG